MTDDAAAVNEVARAIYEDRARRAGADEGAWEDESEFFREEHRADARAALAKIAALQPALRAERERALDDAARVANDGRNRAKKRRDQAISMWDKIEMSGAMDAAERIWLLIDRLRSPPPAQLDPQPQAAAPMPEVE